MDSILRQLLLLMLMFLAKGSKHSSTVVMRRCYHKQQQQHVECMANHVDIPPGLKARFSDLKESSIARYARYLTDKSMSSHSKDFCAEAGLICDDSIDISMAEDKQKRYKKYGDCKECQSQKAIETNVNINIMQISGFFREKQLHKGAKIALQDLGNPTLKRAFLPSSLSSQFPFSSDRLTELLGILNIKRSSVMAKRMASTLYECESKVEEDDEIKFCATSAEELFRLASDVLSGRSNNNNMFGILETSSSQGSHETVELMDVHLRASTKQKVIACHDSPFPYAVFYCHKISNTKVYETSWVASNGNMVHAVALCHMDTTHFDASHPALVELHTKPGKSEVCHWMSESNPVWFSA